MADTPSAALAALAAAASLVANGAAGAMHTSQQTVQTPAHIQSQTEAELNMEIINVKDEILELASERTQNSIELYLIKPAELEAFSPEQRLTV